MYSKYVDHVHIKKEHGKRSFNRLCWELENVFMKHYAPNHMPDPKGGWTLKENKFRTSSHNIFKS